MLFDNASERIIDLRLIACGVGVGGPLLKVLDNIRVQIYRHPDFAIARIRVAGLDAARVLASYSFAEIILSAHLSILFHCAFRLNPLHSFSSPGASAYAR